MTDIAKKLHTRRETVYSSLDNVFKVKNTKGQRGRPPILEADRGPGKKILKAIEVNPRLTYEHMAHDHKLNPDSLTLQAISHFCRSNGILTRVQKPM